MLAASLIAFLSSNQFTALKLAFNFWDPFSISQYRLRQLSEEEYKAAIEDALDEEDFSEAQTLVEIAQENGHQMPADLVERAQENTFAFGLRNARDFANGVITGKVTNTASIGGVLAADAVGVGDVRDVLIQGNSLVRGGDYDRLTLGLALAGLATSASIYVSGVAAPSAAAVDTGVSFVKTANKTGKLSKKLTTRLKIVTTRLVDVDGLKRGLSRISLPQFKRPSMSVVRASFGDINWRNVSKGDFSQVKKPISEMMPVDVSAARKAFSGAVRKEALAEIVAVASPAKGIVSAGGVKAAFRAMEHADDAKELSRFRSLATRMGEKTSAVIKVLGKNAIKLGKLAYLVIITLIALVGWLLGALWFSYALARTAYRAAKRIGATT